MILGNLLKSSSGRYKKIPVKGISFDSRKVKEKNIFFAIDGTKNLGTELTSEDYETDENGTEDKAY